MFTIDEVANVHQVWPAGGTATTSGTAGLETDWTDLDTHVLLSPFEQGMSFGDSETNDGLNPTGGAFGDGIAGMGTFAFQVLDVADVPGASYAFFQFVARDTDEITVTGSAIQGLDPSIDFALTVGEDINDDPIVGDDSAITDENTPVTTDNVLANDYDPEGDPLTVDTVTQAAHGTVTDHGDGTFTYTPQPGFYGTDSFTYTVTDGQGGSATATVTIVVNHVAPNQDPVAQDNSYTTDRNGPFTTSNVLANDYDPDGGTLTITDVTQPSHGIVADNGDGTFTYTLTSHTPSATAGAAPIPPPSPSPSPRSPSTTSARRPSTGPSWTAGGSTTSAPPPPPARTSSACSASTRSAASTRCGRRPTSRAPRPTRSAWRPTGSTWTPTSCSHWPSRS